MAKENVYYPKLDGLRAIACILVLFFHSSFNSTYKNSFIFLPFKGGYLGVDLFFVLSGFLITNILFNQYFSQGKIVIVNFLYKRFLRLYPPIILSTIIFLIPLLFYSPNEAVSNMFFILTYSSDLVILFQKIFPILQYPLRFSHTWSLAIEEQFYLFYPFLLNYVLNYCKIKRINILSSFYAFLILFLLIIYLLPIFMGNWFYKFFLWRFFEIFFGSYLSMLTNISYKSLLVRTTTSLKVEEILVKILSNSSYESQPGYHQTIHQRRPNSR